LSAGMRPKPLLSLALPLAVGIEGMRELCEFELAEKPGPEFAARLTAALPGHMSLLSLRPYTAKRSLPARVVGASYEALVSLWGDRAGAGDVVSVLATAADRFATMPELPVEEVREGRVRLVDVRRYVSHVSVREGPGPACKVSFRAVVSPDGTTRPERVIDGLGHLAGMRLEAERIRRTKIHLS